MFIAIATGGEIYLKVDAETQLLFGKAVVAHEAKLLAEQLEEAR